MKKKQWQKPQLVVLLRSKPEEAVLTACKTASLSAGPKNAQEGCGYDNDGVILNSEFVCSTCDGLVAT